MKRIDGGAVALVLVVIAFLLCPGCGEGSQPGGSMGWALLGFTCALIVVALVRLWRMRRKKWRRGPGDEECVDFKPSDTELGARCETDGHYLCDVCCWNVHREIENNNEGGEK